MQKKFSEDSTFIYNKKKAPSEMGIEET